MSYLKCISLKGKGKRTGSKILIGYYFNYSRMCILICRIKALCGNIFLTDATYQESECLGYCEVANHHVQDECVYFFSDLPFPDVSW